MAKKTSPISLLMEFLHVSVQQLSQCLYIDRTTISKWRSGSRRLNEHSPYFEKLVTIFMEKNAQMGNMPLRRLFAEVYPGQPSDTDEELAALVVRYIQDDKAAGMVGQFVEDMQKALYQTTISVFRGVEGRKSAINMVLNLAEGYSQPCVIQILEMDYFEWMSRDMVFLQNFVQKIESLTKIGHRFELSYATAKTGKGVKMVTRALTKLIYSKNFSVSLIDSDESDYIIPSMYGIAGKCIAVSVDYEEDPKNIHTSVYFDDFTVKKYHMVMEKMITNHAAPLNITDDEREKDKILSLLQFTRTKRSPAYFYARTLPLATMSESLMAELLEQNTLSSADKTRCMLLYHTLQDCLLHSPKDSLGGLYVDIEAIEEDAQFDSLVQHELTAFCQKPVIKTREQFARHLADTADFLAENENIRIRAVQGREYDAKMACAWIKKNFWCLGVNGMASPTENPIIFLDDLSLVNMSAELCEEKLSQYPIKYKNTQYITEVFRSLSRGKIPE